MSQTALADTERADVMEGRERGQAPSLQPPPTGLTRLDPCDRCSPITTQYDKIKEYRLRNYGGTMTSMPQIATDQVAEMFQLALTYQSQGRFNDAINLCEQILESGFEQPDTHFFLGCLYQGQQRWDDAIQQYKQLLDNSDYALACGYALDLCYSAQADLRTGTVDLDDVVDSVNRDMPTIEEAPETHLCVVKIYTSPRQGAPMVEQKEITVIKGKGIVGDRYFLDTYDGYFNNHRVPNSERVMTLISLEGIKKGNKVMQAMGATTLKLEETRRNLVVNVGLNTLRSLVGQEFEVGGIRMRGAGHSTPCWRPPTLPGRPADISTFVRAFLDNTGIRVIPLTSGSIREGDPIVLPDVL